MSVGYTSVQWSRHKRIYDLVLVAGILMAVGGFVVAGLVLKPGMTAETAIIRGTALGAFLLLHFILAIGPLARLDRRFLPILYNRRHLGVAMFLVAFVHGAFSLIQFHALGNANPLVSALTAYRGDYAIVRGGHWNLAHFPFEIFGFVALCILFLMAATSHDFWLRNLGASVWKSLHLLVLVAYGAVVLHVALGVLQAETNPLYPALLLLGVAVIFGLHLVTALRERAIDRQRHSAEVDGFVQACRAEEVEEGRGKTVMIEGRRLAVFRQEGRLFGLSNICRHQGGPLGEGKILDGCITCPWHGWQYRAEDGCSPPPFTEVVPTYRLRLVGDEIYVHPEELPLQTKSRGEEAPPAPVPGGEGPGEEFYVGYLPMPEGLGRRLRWVALGLLLLLPAVTVLISAAQQPFDEGTFEFGVVRPFEGVLLEKPVPLLQLERDGEPNTLLLVGGGKFGIPEVARGHHGQRVAFEGSVIYRRGLSMVEMNSPESFRVLGPPSAGAVPETSHLGPATLVGEIVDTKCFLGVMRPAVGKVHRGCAIRCISGGVPPGLLVRSPDGSGTVFLLAGPPGQALEFDVEWAGRVVEAEGELSRMGDVPLFQVRTMTLVEGR